MLMFVKLCIIKMNALLQINLSDISSMQSKNNLENYYTDKSFNVKGEAQKEMAFNYNIRH